VKSFTVAQLEKDANAKAGTDSNVRAEKGMLDRPAKVQSYLKNKGLVQSLLPKR